MGKEEIEKIVTSYIKQSAGGLQIENPKFDFKEQWYNLSSKPGINEFLKDTSAIANTFGPDGFIVIGYNDKNNTFHDTTFHDSKLGDTSKITDLVNRKVDRLFTLSVYDTVIEGHKLSIVHIPPSIDKPHVITNYQTFNKDGTIKKEESQRIFVRKGTATYPASKHDIELMYYDRKNIIPEYKIHSSFHVKTLSLDVHYNHHNPDWNKTNSFPVRTTISLTIENLGLRPVSITNFILELFLFEDSSELEKLKLKSLEKYLSEPITIQPGQIKNEKIDFTSDAFTNCDWVSAREKAKEFEKTVTNQLTKSMILALSTGEQIISDLTIATK